MSLVAQYRTGTQRLVCPERTLRRISPHLEAIGITRCADVTRLDTDMGVPTYCAIRPGARWLQVSNGKGISVAAAKASALMEAIEVHHAESPAEERLCRASRNEMIDAGRRILEPMRADGFRAGFYTHDFRIQWTMAEAIPGGESVWVPAAAVYLCDDPTVHSITTNGLASGNHPVEASLHALYELLERDVLAGIVENGRLKIAERCQAIDTTTVDNTTLAEILDKIQTADNRLILMYLPSQIPVHTFWAVLLNHDSSCAVTSLNIGLGTHANLEVAAARAVTESVQSRLTAVQGAREDIINKPVYGRSGVRSSRAYQYFRDLKCTTNWLDLLARARQPSDDLKQEFDWLVAELHRCGHGPVLRCDLTRREFGIPVVKLIVPSLRLNRRLV